MTQELSSHEQALLKKYKPLDVSNPYLEFLARYDQDVIAMVRDVFDDDPLPWQLDAMHQYNQRRRRISIRSGHGVGKSTLLAWLMVHHLLCRYPQKTVCTAPTTGQLYDALWAEFVSKLQKLPKPLLDLIEIKADRVELKGAPKSSFVSARASRAEQPEAMAGVHSEGWVLLIADEASGIPDRVFEAASGSMSGRNAMTILTGNPVRATGFFHDTHTRLSDLWWTRRVSCTDADVAKLVDPDYIEDQRRRYGVNSNAYRVRVLGEFPISDDDAVIPFDLIEAALSRDVEVENVRPIWGVDVARFGSNRSALAKRQGNVLLEPVRYWHGLDAAQLSGRVLVEWESTPLGSRPAAINIDSIGYGGDVVTRLRDLGLPARGINVSESPALRNSERYRDLKTELWFDAREWFSARNTKLPAHYKDDRSDDNLCQELAAVSYDFNPKTGKAFVESKEEVKQKLRGTSPDGADAFILTFASSSISLMGLGGKTSWKTKLSRPLKCLS